VEKRLFTRYATSSQVAADENQKRIEGVFEELAQKKPDNVSYIVLRLADDSFVHVSSHNHRDDEPNPISSSAPSLTSKTDTRVVVWAPVEQQTATLVGSYVTEIALRRAKHHTDHPPCKRPSP